MGAIPNAITLTGYGLGIWWSLGGPTWAGLASIVADEIDGWAARKLDQTSETGDVLDSTADAALTPLALIRLGKATNTGAKPLLIGAPPLLLLHAETRATKQKPPLGSMRAGIMLGTMLIEVLKKR